MSYLNIYSHDGPFLKIAPPTGKSLKDALTKDVADTEIQLHLLADYNQNKIFEEFVEWEEAGKRSATHLIQIHRVAAEKQLPSTNDPLRIVQ